MNKIIKINMGGVKVYLKVKDFISSFDRYPRLITFMFKGER